MSKSIKVSDEVYNDLLKMQQPRETLSEIIKRLIRVYATLFSIKETLGPSHYLNERPVVDARAKETIDRRGNRPTLPDVPIH